MAVSAETGSAVAAVEVEPVAVKRAPASEVARKAAPWAVGREAGLGRADTGTAAVAAAARAKVHQEIEGARVVGPRPVAERPVAGLEEAGAATGSPQRDRRVRGSSLWRVVPLPPAFRL